MAIIMTLGATSITLPNPNYPGRLRRQRYQLRNVALGGRTLTLNMVGTTRIAQPRLSWVDPGLTLAEFDDLEGFIQTTADGSSNSFTLTDWDADTWTVVYWSGIEDFGRVRHNRMAGTVELREVPT